MDDIDIIFHSKLKEGREHTESSSYVECKIVSVATLVGDCVAENLKVHQLLLSKRLISSQLMQKVRTKKLFLVLIASIICYRDKWPSSVQNQVRKQS